MDPDHRRLLLNLYDAHEAELHPEPGRAAIDDYMRILARTKEHTMTLNRILLLAAVICLAVAWFVSTGFDDGGWSNPGPWGYGGLALGFASFLPAKAI